MANWQGWVAALGGLISLGEFITAQATPAYATLGGIVAIVFGIWAAYSP